jgi:hypothetical protein
MLNKISIFLSVTGGAKFRHDMARVFDLLGVGMLVVTMRSPVRRRLREPPDVCLLRSAALILSIVVCTSMYQSRLFLAQEQRSRKTDHIPCTTTPPTTKQRSENRTRTLDLSPSEGANRDVTPLRMLVAPAWRLYVSFTPLARAIEHPG